MIAVRYTLMRLLIFFGIFALLLLLDINWMWAAIGAMALSMIASYFLLARDREAMAAGLERRIEDRVAKRQEKIASERTADDAVDADGYDADADDYR